MSTKLQTHFGMCAAAWLAFLAALPSGHASENVPRFCCEAPSGPAQFVKEEITRAAGTAGVQAPELVELTVGDLDAPQSYRIERDGGTVRVVGADIAGLIYGGLDVAANLRRYAETAKRTVAELHPRQGENKELRLTLGDIEAFSCLGSDNKLLEKWKETKECVLGN